MHLPVLSSLQNTYNLLFYSLICASGTIRAFLSINVMGFELRDLVIVLESWLLWVAWLRVCAL
jgi:hypothetical protein